jgi:hypothetical protein
MISLLSFLENRLRRMSSLYVAYLVITPPPGDAAALPGAGPKPG